MNESQAPDTFIGNGPVYMARIENGVVGKLFWVGDASVLSFAHEVSDKKEHYESFTGNQQLYDSTGGKKKTTMSLTMHERKKETLRVVLQAQVEEVAGSTDQVVLSRNDIEAGDIWSLATMGISSVEITDSTEAEAKVLEVDTHYKINEFGLVEIVALPEGATLPLSAKITHPGKTVFKPMTDTVEGYYLEYHCTNTAGKKETSLVKTYRLNPDPASAFDLINEDFSELALEGECLYDAAAGAPYTVEYPKAAAAE